MQTVGRSGGSSLVCTLAEISRRLLIPERGTRVICSATRVSGSVGGVERPEQKHLVDSLVNRIDEQWSVVKDPQHAMAILQMFRHCHTVGRNMPKRMMVRFVLAKDAEDGKLWVLPDARGVFPGRGMHVASSYPSIAQASNWFAKAFQHGNLRLPYGMERIIEAELLRLTQRRLLEAFISATSVRCLRELPLTAEEEGQQPSDKTTALGKTFLETLDTAVSHAIAAQMKRSIETNTDATKRTTWMIQMNDGEGKERKDMMEVRTLDENKQNARVLHVLSAEEIRKAVDISHMPQDKTELQARHHEFLSLLDGAKNIQQGTKGGVKLVLLCGVDNESSSRLQHEQLRLHTYRQTRAEAGSIIETRLKARRSNKKNSGADNQKAKSS